MNEVQWNRNKQTVTIFTTRWQYHIRVLIWNSKPCVFLPTGILHSREHPLNFSDWTVLLLPNPTAGQIAVPANPDTGGGVYLNTGRVKSSAAEWEPAVMSGGINYRDEDKAERQPFDIL